MQLSVSMRPYAGLFLFLALTCSGCRENTSPIGKLGNKAQVITDANRKKTPQRANENLGAEKRGDEAGSDELAALPDQERMIRRLKQIQEEKENNPYLDGALIKAQERYDRAKVAGNPYATMSALYDLGIQFTQQGDPDRGLATLNELESLLDDIKKRQPDAVNPKMELMIDLSRAIACIRKGENENCIHCLGGEGCLFPIGPGGIHKHPEGSTAALPYLASVLEQDPQNYSAIWLLNLAHMTLGSHPDGVPEEYRLPEQRLRSAIDFPRFPNISTDLKIDTLSHAGGVVVEDFDADNDLDLFVSSWTSDGQCRYYRNDGNAGFVDVTEEAGLIGIVGGLNTRQIDFDNDGDPDVVILRGAWLGKFGKHPNSLLRNDDGKKFVEVAFEKGIAGDDFPTQVGAVADYDLDGDLDLFVGNEKAYDQLFRNDGDHFTEVGRQVGVAGLGTAKGAAWGDVDNDGDPDLYVSNMGGQNQLFRNEGNGKFERWDVAGINAPRQSFSCWFFDYNNDGNLDLFVAAYDEGIGQIAADFLGDTMRSSEHDRLYRGDGKGGFEDVSESVGLGRISHTMGSNFGDLNNDGLLDFYLATGTPAIESLEPNLMYLNQEGERFVDVSIAGGFSHLQKGHAIAFADLDHDGDQDVFAELGGAFKGDAFQNAMFQNPGFEGGWVKLKLVGIKSNRSAIGARVEIVTDGPSGERRLHRVVDTGSSFGSNPLRLHVGLADATAIKAVNVRWPGIEGVEVFHGIEPSSLYQLIEGLGNAEKLELRKIDWPSAGTKP